MHCEFISFRLENLIVTFLNTFLFIRFGSENIIYINIYLSSTWNIIIIVTVDLIILFISLRSKWTNLICKIFISFRQQKIEIKPCVFVVIH